MNTFTSHALPEPVTQDYPFAWSLSGEGIFSWTVFKLYRARLFVSGSRFDANQPFILDLTYLRSLPAEMIVSASMEELKRLRQPDQEVLQSWSEALSQIVPDVVLDDRLVGCFTPGQGVRFYAANALLGEIADPAFAEAFAAIWLDPETKSATLREALLGGATAATQAGA